MGNTCLVPNGQHQQGPISIRQTRIGAIFFVQPGNDGHQSSDHIQVASSLTRYKRRRRSTVASLNSLECHSPSSRSFLSRRDKELIERCWREHICIQRRDIFHRTMLFCIEASPKITEVIACGRYCYKDLTKWPKLNRICQAQFAFFEKLIYLHQLEERQMFDQCWRLGQMHANYAQFGLKPHFLDIYQQQLLGVLARMEIRDKAETCIAFTHFSTFVIEVMNEAYSHKCAEFRNGTSSPDKI